MSLKICDWVIYHYKKCIYVQFYDKNRLQTWKLIHFEFSEGFGTHFNSPYELFVQSFSTIYRLYSFHIELFECIFITFSLMKLVKLSNYDSKWFFTIAIHLKGWVHMANQNGLKSLQKIWNELTFMFVTQSCQKIGNKCIIYHNI